MKTFGRLHWKLDAAGEPVCFEGDFLEWAEWFETADRIVARDEIGDQTVSTVFLGLDHAFCGGPPVLFETMVFRGRERSTLTGREHPTARYEKRHHTRAEALAHHERVVEALRADWKPDYGKEPNA
jgi:hypothetical protein